MPKRSPAATAARKDESRHDQWWYPARCELPGCTEEHSREELKKCSGCYMVQYCCRDHQKEDWSAHKEECKLFSRLGLRSTFYTDEEMLAAYPLKPRPSDRAVPPPIPQGTRCPLCRTSEKKEAMTRTRCCHQVVCDTSSNYQLMSYSREYCERSHDRYTLCGFHGVERECDKTKDWRECPRCTSDQYGGGMADTLWRGLNSYNFYPLLSKDVPRHARCDVCASCKKKFIVGVQGGSHSRKGLTCLLCSTAGMGAYAGMAAVDSG